MKEEAGKPKEPNKESDSDVSVSGNPFMCYYVKLRMMFVDCYGSLNADSRILAIGMIYKASYTKYRYCYYMRYWY